MCEPVILVKYKTDVCCVFFSFSPAETKKDMRFKNLRTFWKKRVSTRTFFWTAADVAGCQEEKFGANLRS